MHFISDLLSMSSKVLSPGKIYGDMFNEGEKMGMCSIRDKNIWGLNEDFQRENIYRNVQSGFAENMCLEKLCTIEFE